MLWNKIIRLCLKVQLNNTFTPEFTLEKWLHPYSERQMIHRLLFSPSYDHIINQSSNKIVQYDVNKKMRNIAHYNRASNTFITSIPDGFSPISTKQNDVFTIYLGYKFIVKNYPIITSFKHYICIFPNWKEQLISSYLNNHHYKLLAVFIENKEDIIISITYFRIIKHKHINFYMISHIISNINLHTISNIK